MKGNLNQLEVRGDRDVVLCSFLSYSESYSAYPVQSWNKTRFQLEPRLWLWSNSLTYGVLILVVNNLHSPASRNLIEI